MHLDTISNREIYCELIELRKAKCGQMWPNVNPLIFPESASHRIPEIQPLTAEVSTA